MHERMKELRRRRERKGEYCFFKKVQFYVCICFYLLCKSGFEKSLAVSLSLTLLHTRTRIAKQLNNKSVSIFTRVHERGFIVLVSLINLDS